MGTFYADRFEFEEWNFEGDEPTPDEIAEFKREHELGDIDLHERYDEYLDEVSDRVEIGSLTYDASRVLKAIDPIAYNVGYNEWEDRELDEDGSLVEVDDQTGKEI